MALLGLPDVRRLELSDCGDCDLYAFQAGLLLWAQQTNSERWCFPRPPLDEGSRKQAIYASNCRIESDAFFTL